MRRVGSIELAVMVVVVVRVWAEEEEKDDASLLGSKGEDFFSSDLPPPLSEVSAWEPEAVVGRKVLVFVLVVITVGDNWLEEEVVLTGGAVESSPDEGVREVLVVIRDGSSAEKAKEKRERERAKAIQTNKKRKETNAKTKRTKEEEKKRKMGLPSPFFFSSFFGVLLIYFSEVL